MARLTADTHFPVAEFVGRKPRCMTRSTSLLPRERLPVIFMEVAPLCRPHVIAAGQQNMHPLLCCRIDHIAAGMLFGAILPLPYGYYTLLRVAATGVFLWAAYLSHTRNYRMLTWIFSIAAIIFNPIIRVHLAKELWTILDLGAGILLLLTKKRIEEGNTS